MQAEPMGETEEGTDRPGQSALSVPNRPGLPHGLPDPSYFITVHVGDHIVLLELLLFICLAILLYSLLA